MRWGLIVSRHSGGLYLTGRAQGKCHANGRTLSWRGVERDPAAELLRHEIMDDVEAEAGAPLRTSGGEERIKNLALDGLRDAATVVGENDLGLVRAEAMRPDQHVSAGAAGEAVGD